MKKVKITYIDPGKGVFGMHDGWGDWPKNKYYRVLGILFCKKHYSIPHREYNSWASCYTFTCDRCSKEEDYEYRKTRILKLREAGFKKRLELREKQYKDAEDMLNVLKELYGA